MVEPFFRGNPVSFEDAFPEIEEIKIEGTEGDVAQKHKIVLNKKSLGISCSNSLCEKGGYQSELGNLISEMYRKKEVFKEDIVSCKGHENMGRGQTRRCLNHLCIKANITYKTPAT